MSCIFIFVYNRNSSLDYFIKTYYNNIIKIQRVLNMKKCKFCEQELPDEINFCPYCMKSQNFKKKVTPKSMVSFRLYQKPKKIRFSKNPVILSLQYLMCVVIITVGIILSAGVLVGIIDLFLDYAEATARIIPFLPY